MVHANRDLKHTTIFAQHGKGIWHRASSGMPLHLKTGGEADADLFNRHINGGPNSPYSLALGTVFWACYICLLRNKARSSVIHWFEVRQPRPITHTCHTETWCRISHHRARLLNKIVLGRKCFVHKSKQNGFLFLYMECQKYHYLPADQWACSRHVAPLRLWLLFLPCSPNLSTCANGCGWCICDDGCVSCRPTEVLMMSLLLQPGYGTEAVSRRG